MENSFVWKSPIGVLKLCEENGSLTRLDLTEEKPEGAFAPGVRHSDFLYEAYIRIQEYFAGKRQEFDLPVNPAGTEFQKRVWRELRRIPYGETRSYADIAAAIGSPGAVRAVGGANHRNPILIVVPCHRVIRKNGELGGFGCGEGIKRYLLELEEKHKTERNGKAAEAAEWEGR